MTMVQNRRHLLSCMSLATVAGLTGFSRSVASAELSPETASVRFVDFPGGACIAPQYVAEELLRGEGFTGYRHVTVDSRGTATAMISDDLADFGLDFVSAVVAGIDSGVQVKALSGVHVGCWELVAREGINSVLDLKGKRVGVGTTLGSDPHLYVSAMATFVGLDPKRDIEWVMSDVLPIELFAEGNIDALLAVALEVQVLRARKLGHVVVSGIHDRPWSEYFCCLLVARSDYVERHPVATKRVVRAILKGADLCSSDPDTVARQMIEAGHADNYDYAARMIAEIPYAAWRDLDPEDSIRFFALRLHEAGIVTTNPREIVSRCADWRFLDELKRELKT